MGLCLGSPMISCVRAEAGDLSRLAHDLVDVVCLSDEKVVESVGFAMNEYGLRRYRMV